MAPKTDLAIRIKAKIRELEAVVAATPAQGRPLSVMGGASGSMLHYFYLAKMQDSGALYDRAFELLEQTLDAIEQQGIDYVTYCDGAAGFGVLFQLLAREGFIEVDLDDIMPALDEVVVAYTLAQLQVGNLDFLHGAIGNGFYLLGRVGTPATDECLAQLLAYLVATAVHDAQGIRWADQPSALNAFTAGVINLSLSHGLSSKLIFLAHCLRAKVEVATCTTLIRGVVQYIQQQAHPASSSNVYPSVVTPTGGPRLSNRLAWCYGDLGVATAFFVAGQALGEATWVAQALGLARRATGRVALADTGVLDAGFCHGTAGVAHIFHRFYLASQDEEFRHSRDYWLEQTLAHATFPDGLAGYKAYQQDAWLCDEALLEGVLGISLVLQSALEEETVNLSWDAMFLLNIS
jgi:hypothetical protein